MKTCNLCGKEGTGGFYNDDSYCDKCLIEIQDGASNYMLDQARIDKFITEEESYKYILNLLKNENKDNKSDKTAKEST